MDTNGQFMTSLPLPLPVSSHQPRKSVPLEPQTLQLHAWILWCLLFELWVSPRIPTISTARPTITAPFVSTRLAGGISLTILPKVSLALRFRKTMDYNFLAFHVRSFGRKCCTLSST